MVKMASRKLLLGAILSHAVSLLWKFYWAGAWVHEYTKLRTVSLHDVNSLTCIALYFFLGRGIGQAPSSNPSPARQ